MKINTRLSLMLICGISIDMLFGILLFKHAIKTRAQNLGMMKYDAALDKMIYKDYKIKYLIDGK